MRVLRSGLFLLAITLAGCSAESGPVSIPVPFSGSLTADARVVVADGLPVSSQSSLQSSLKDQVEPGTTCFKVFNSDGALSGSCNYGPSEPVTSTEVLEGRRDEYFLPATCNLCSDRVCDNLQNEDDVCNIDLLRRSETIESVSADLDCFDYPHDDPTLETPAGSESRHGACSEAVIFGTGSFVDSVDAALMDGRFVAFSHVENGTKRFDELLKWNWILHRVGEQMIPPLLTEASGHILADTFLAIDVPNGQDFVQFPIEDCVPRQDIPPLLAELECAVLTCGLFCEGQDPLTDLPCGKLVKANIVYDLNVPGHETETSTQTVCKGTSCVTAFHVVTLRSQIPVTNPDIPGGRTFNITFTQHDPVLCRDMTGDFREAACPGLGDDDLANVELDYRCVSVFDESEAFLKNLGSAFIVSVPQ